MTKNKSKPRSTGSCSSIRLTMIFIMLFGIAVAVLLFFLINFSVRRYISEKYLTPENAEERNKSYREELQAYITDNRLDSDDIDEIAKWAQKQKYLYIMIYKDDEILFQTGDVLEKDDEIGENKENADQDPSENGTGDGTDTDGGDVTDPDGGDGTDPDGGDSTDPDVGDGTDPDGGDSTDPDGGDVTDPDGGDSTDPDGGDGTDPDGGDSTDPDVGDGTESGGGEDEENQYPGSGITVKPPTRDELIQNAIKNGRYPLNMSDGGILLVSLVEYTEYLYYDIGNIVSIITAMAALIVIMWLYFYGITKRIAKLDNEVRVIAEGEIDRRISYTGDDEISRLSMNVEYMRSSMLSNIEKERAALDSNKELITSMSHDIRTPLTVLLGYIDIMKMNDMDEHMRSYVSSAEQTALRLKRMSDDMFGYFLVYGGAIEVTLGDYNAKTLIEQMFDEHLFLLEEQGYVLRTNLGSDMLDGLADVSVNTDPSLLMRIVENIFSNIMKYADKEKEISFDFSVNDDKMTIKVVNYIAKNPDMAQKNGIGLKSCDKISAAMNVEFTHCERDGIYESAVAIPLAASEHLELQEEIKSYANRRFSRKLRNSFIEAVAPIGRFFKRVGIMVSRPVRSLILRIKRKRGDE